MPLVEQGKRAGEDRQSGAGFLLVARGQYRRQQATGVAGISFVVVVVGHSFGRRGCCLHRSGSRSSISLFVQFSEGPTPRRFEKVQISAVDLRKHRTGQLARSPRQSTLAERLLAEFLVVVAVVVVAVVTVVVAAAVAVNEWKHSNSPRRARITAHSLKQR